jgi:4-hydroxybenzoate polyprenyltransferase
VNLRDAIQLMRPRQWTKNLVVLAAIIFSDQLFNLSHAITIALAFVSFCLVSSALYALNDVVDAERDRLHPIKKERPVASGRMTPSTALAISAVLSVLGIVLGWTIGVYFFMALGVYVALQLLYSFGLKNIAIVDLLLISGGFVVRAVAGALAIQVTVSPWLVVCTALLAMFLVTAKRRHELVLLQGESLDHRPVLSEYTPELLDSFLVTLSGATITAYMLYAFYASTTPYYLTMLTVPFVMYGVLRYQMLVLGRGRGGRPEEILLNDRPTLINIVLWMLTVVAIHYVIIPRFFT